MSLRPLHYMIALIGAIFLVAIVYTYGYGAERIIYHLYLMNGTEMHDVDAFKTKEQCMAAKEEMQDRINQAKKARPDLDLWLAGCQPEVIKEPSRG